MSSATGVLVRADNHNIHIVGTADVVQATALVSSGWVDPNGQLNYAYTGETKVDSESQTTRLRDELMLFVDEEDRLVPESNVVVLLPDGSTVRPSETQRGKPL